MEPCSPIIPGHEMIGKVVAVGPGDKPLYKIGDRIGAGWHGGHDGTSLCCSSINRTVNTKSLLNVTTDGKRKLIPDIGNCKACKKGFFQMCENAAVNGVSRNGGCTWSLIFNFPSMKGFAHCTSDAEYCTLREEAAVHIPSHADAASYAPLLCAGVTVFNSMRRLQIPPGEVVAIQGLGGLGHLAIQYVALTFAFDFQILNVAKICPQNGIQGRGSFQ